MIIVDTALKARAAQGRPIRVGMIGAGFMGQGLANQMINSMPGLRLVAVYGRRLDRARHVYSYSGRDDALVANSQRQLDEAIAAGRPVITEDPFLLSRSEHIDVLIDVTGRVLFNAAPGDEELQRFLDGGRVKWPSQDVIEHERRVRRYIETPRGLFLVLGTLITQRHQLPKLYANQVVHRLASVFVIGAVWGIVWSLSGWLLTTMGMTSNG